MFSAFRRVPPAVVFTLAAALSAFVAGCGSHAPPGTSDAPTFNERGISEFSLNNGMRVVVKHDDRAPLAVVQVWYRVGSSDEPNGITGISHVLEHMMFKGTARYPGEVLTEVLKRAGARNNAFTSADYTAYYEVIRNDRMELAFDVESDRMVNLILRQEDFDKEIEVVKEERRWRVDDKPRSRLYEEFYAVAFNNNPYRNPVIGWMDDLNNISLGDLERWYSQWYAPNNAVLVVAGHVDPAEVWRLARQYFEPVPARPVPARKPRRDTQRDMRRSIELSAPAEEAHLVIGYPAPVIGHSEVEWHPYALWMLSNVLGGSANSRLRKKLHRELEIAREIGSSYSAHSLYDGLFVISATPQPGVDVETIREAVFAEVENIKSGLVSGEELLRALTQARANQVYAEDSIMHQAIRIGRMEITGYGWHAPDDFLDQVRKITPMQVREAARIYLADTRLIMAVLDPQPMDTGMDTDMDADMRRAIRSPAGDGGPETAMRPSRRQAR